MAVMLFAALFVLNCIDKFSAKKMQMMTQFDWPRIVAANVVNGLVSVLFYLVVMRTGLYFEPKMELMSFLYGVLCFAGLVLGIELYKHASIPLASIIVTSSSIVGSSLFGYVILGESVTAARLIAAAALFAAVALPAIEGVHGKNRMKKSDLLFCAFYFLFAVAANIMGTVYVAFEGMEGRQYCLHVNIYILVICVAVAACLPMCKKATVRGMVTSLTPAQTGMLSLRGVMSQIMSVCIVALVAIIPITMYNIINCSLSMIASVLVALVYYKEKLTARQLISLVLLVAAAGLSSL